MKNFKIKLFILIAIFSCEPFDAEKDKELSSQLYDEGYEDIVQLETKNENIDLINPNDTSFQIGGDSIIITNSKRNPIPPFLWFVNIASPRFKGETLQANTVFIYKDYAFIGFNTKGSSYLGAIMTLDLKNVINPKIVQVLTISNGDINSIYYQNGNLYVGGATNAFSDPAFVMTAKMSSDMKMSDLKFFNYPSFGVTDFTRRGKDFIASVGEEGGGFVQTNFDNVENINLIKQNNARAVVSNSNNVFLLTAYSARIHWYQKSNFSLVRQSDFFKGAEQIDAKSTLELEKNILVAAVGEGGTRFFDTKGNKFEDIGAIPQIDFTSKGLPLLKSTSNAATAEASFVFTSSGESGVHCYYFMDNKLNVIDVSSIDKKSFYVYSGYLSFGAGISVNHVKYKNKYLIVASGLGGVQILRFIPPTSFLPSGDISYDDLDDYDD
jgi:hypothetical protein